MGLYEMNKVSIQSRKVHSFRIGVVYNDNFPKCFAVIKAAQLKELQRLSVHKCFYLGVPGPDALAEGVLKLANSKKFEVIVVVGLFSTTKAVEAMDNTRALAKRARERVKQVDPTSRQFASLVMQDVWLKGDDPTQAVLHRAGVETAGTATKAGLRRSLPSLAKEPQSQPAPQRAQRPASRPTDQKPKHNPGSQSTPTDPPYDDAPPGYSEYSEIQVIDSRPPSMQTGSAAGPSDRATRAPGMPRKGPNTNIIGGGTMSGTFGGESLRM